MGLYSIINVGCFFIAGDQSHGIPALFWMFSRGYFYFLSWIFFMQHMQAVSISLTCALLSKRL